MAAQNRRDFLKTMGIIGVTAAGFSTSTTKAQEKFKLSEDRIGVLVDTTVCIGCRNCEWACKKVHDLPAGSLEEYNDRSVFENKRRPDEHALTVVNEFENPDNVLLPVDVKVQCMHCEEPACVSACIVNAYTKHPEGPVTWDSDKCIGCRYCMVACPWQIPAFEYDKAIQPNIMKCDFCYDRQQEGKLPACVEICPEEALIFGKRRDLIEIARQKIKREPDRYVDHILGENEVGGTSWLYLAGQNFSKLDFPKLGTDPAPGVTEKIQHGIFAYFIPPISLYALLGGIMWINRGKSKSKEV
ncbi:formate dehydrogenase, nitrate-inducible, iron-sulfur subunit [bacterium BMS3Abin03]|nr:formate dehydrogenase, nitrate-inducible, iron-sulfur subunit [bacterium BMS3Abin03]